MGQVLKCRETWLDGEMRRREGAKMKYRESEECILLIFSTKA